jgi:hypothetical protein
MQTRRAVGAMSPERRARTDSLALMPASKKWGWSQWALGGCPSLRLAFLAAPEPCEETGCGLPVGARSF